MFPAVGGFSLLNSCVRVCISDFNPPPSPCLRRDPSLFSIVCTKLAGPNFKGVACLHLPSPRRNTGITDGQAVLCPTLCDFWGPDSSLYTFTHRARFISPALPRSTLHSPTNQAEKKSNNIRPPSVEKLKAKLTRLLSLLVSGDGDPSTPLPVCGGGQQFLRTLMCRTIPFLLSSPSPCVSLASSPFCPLIMT